MVVEYADCWSVTYATKEHENAFWRSMKYLGSVVSGNQGTAVWGGVNRAPTS